MSEPSDSYTRHSPRFERVYDLDDPSPYFNTIGPSEYRMPAALAGALKAMHGPLCALRGAGEPLRVLDFACGYGAIGALLRHDLSMAALYARYRARQWQPADGRRYWDDDIAFFAARRAETAAFEIGGIDIAGNAVAYAAALGFVDRAFPENLVDDAPSDELARFLPSVQLVVESGALGVLLPAGVRARARLRRRREPAVVSLLPASRRELVRAGEALGRTGLPHGEFSGRPGPLPQAAGGAGRGGHASPGPRASASPTTPSCRTGTFWWT